MKKLLIMCVILIFLIQQTSCFIKQKKLTEFLQKLQEISAATPAYPPIASPTSTKDVRVFYPVDYGADPTGEQESSDAIMQALSNAFHLQSGLELLPGVTDFGGAVLDLQGGNYKISKPIRFPASGGGNLLVQRGTLRASDTFPGDRHLVELWSLNSQKLGTKSFLNSNMRYDEKSQNVGIYYEDITFRDILFDSSYQGGGILIVDSARIRINNCFFLHFKTEGILVEKGHETFISNSFLGQHSTVGGDKGERDFSGTAIDLASNDNAITDVAIFSGAIGIKLRGQTNIITGVHCYNKATSFGGIGILKVAGASLTRIDNCYLDFTNIILEDPIQVHVTNGLFLGDASLILKPINGQISGLNIVDNMFNGNQENMNPIIVLDGQFKNIDQVVIERNNVNGMSLKSTVGKLKIAGNGTKWVADFSSLLVFPNKINHFQYSFSVQGTAPGSSAFRFTNHAVTNVSNNVVIVESERAINGTVSVFVDQYNMHGE